MERVHNLACSVGLTLTFHGFGSPPVQGYYERMLKGGDVTSALPTSKVLQQIVISGIPSGQQAPLYINLFMNGELEYTSKVGYKFPSS